MNACETWLAADYLIREGHTLIIQPDGTRVAVVGRLPVQLPPVCTCMGCPPLPAVTLERKAA